MNECMTVPMLDNLMRLILEKIHHIFSMDFIDSSLSVWLVITMDEDEIREREAAILKARENLSDETLKEYRDIFSFFDRWVLYKDHNYALPALLCHKEPARRIQSPLLGALGGILLAPRWFFMA